MLNKKSRENNENESECIKEKQYNLDLLTDDSVKFLYKLRLANKLDSI
jgi:hypothetical protein